MEKLISWIKTHKLFFGLLILLSFFTPMIIVHILFNNDARYEWLKAEWAAGDVLAYIAGFEAFIGTISLGALALWQNQRIHIQQMESLAPALSMNLISLGGMLYLTVENTGQSEAHDISISVDWIENNGRFTNLALEDLFSRKFELYPKETVQGRVAFSGADISTHIFPQVTVTVSYFSPLLKRQEHYVRRVIYDNGYAKKMTVDVDVDNKTLESDIDAMARAVVRVANYLDGCQVAKFDKLNILAGKSLKNDIVEAIKTKEETPILSRDETIKEAFNTDNEL